MVKRAKMEMPLASFYVGEAASLPIPDASQDLVFSYSVFFYFDTFDYASRVMKEMLRIAKPGKFICIWDVPDIRKKEESILVRGACKPGYEHMYYEMDDLINWFKDNGALQVSGEYRQKSFYQHSAYRFHITAKKG